MTEIALAVVHDRIRDRVLLIQRAGCTDFQGWASPGGKLEENAADHEPATPVEAARRELLEESGVAATSEGRPILTRLHPRTGVTVSHVYFAVDQVGPELRPRKMEPSKAACCRWFPRSTVGEMFAPGFSPEVLRRLDLEADQRARARPKRASRAREPEQATATR